MVSLLAFAWAVLALLACGDLAEEPGTSPTAPAGMFSTLPTSEAPVVGDQPPTIELNTAEPTVTPQPTPTAQSDLHAAADAYSTAHANTRPDGHSCANADNRSDRHTSADGQASTHVHALSDLYTLSDTCAPTCDRANLGSRANSNRCANPSTHT